MGKIKKETVEQLIKVIPTLPPTRLLHELIEKSAYLLSGLSLGKLELDNIEDEIKEICRGVYMIDRMLEKPEAKQAMEDQEKDLVGHFVNNIDKEAFEDMVDAFGEHMKAEGVNEADIKRHKRHFANQRLLDIDT